MLQRNLTIFYFLFLLCQNVAGSSGNNKLSSEFKDDISNHPHPKKPRYGSPLSAVIRITPRDNVQDEQGLTGNGFIKGEAINMRSVPTVSSTYTSSHSMNTYQQADNLVKSRGTVNRNANQKAVHYRSKSSFSAAPKLKLEDKSATNTNYADTPYMVPGSGEIIQVPDSFGKTMRKIISTDPFTHIIDHDDFMEAFANCNSVGVLGMPHEPNRVVKKMRKSKVGTIWKDRKLITEMLSNTDTDDLPNIDADLLSMKLDRIPDSRLRTKQCMLLVEHHRNKLKVTDEKEQDFPIMAEKSRNYRKGHRHICYAVNPYSIGEATKTLKNMIADARKESLMCGVCSKWVPNVRLPDHILLHDLPSNGASVALPQEFLRTLGGQGYRMAKHNPAPKASSTTATNSAFFERSVPEVVKNALNDLANVDIKGLWKYTVEIQSVAYYDSMEDNLIRIIKTHRSNEDEFPLMIGLARCLSDGKQMYDIPNRLYYTLIKIIEQMKTDCQVDCQPCDLCSKNGLTFQVSTAKSGFYRMQHMQKCHPEASQSNSYVAD
eukprot:649513_1